MDDGVVNRAARRRKRLKGPASPALSRPPVPLVAPPLSGEQELMLALGNLSVAEDRVFGAMRLCRVQGMSWAEIGAIRCTDASSAWRWYKRREARLADRPGRLS